ncbi:myosin heavy chain-like protein [Thalictrum thalictroides]|uniref:Myosin heavy chain-like protein n=1 Tax=Thalictrum thalictroides TaxID=46969 RepID=A0A7J6W1W7_THATH|nr:myosin heavy chain-like protein [Thalictrum thalictroides]
MSSSLKINNNDHSFDIDELLRIGTLCMELRKEKDMLRDSQVKSAELIRGLELDVKSLSEARLEDKKYIQDLERELQSCSEEIGTLQDHLNLRNIEANWLGEHVHSLELKLVEAVKLHEKVSQLREELLGSNSDRLYLMRNLENKEMELHKSQLCIEKLEEAISSIALDSECEIESMKLDLLNLEQMSSEARKIQEKTTHEKARMDDLIEEFAVKIQDSQKVIKLLEEENRDLKNKLKTSQSISRIEEQLKDWLEKNDRSQNDFLSCSNAGSKIRLSNELGFCEEVLGPLISKLAVVASSDENLKDEVEKMLQQIHEYELLVERLKDELREEKVKAKEEAEDLTQEMAELRYQSTCMLEEECKRRAHIEQASLQRIAELEAQVQKEQKRLALVSKHLLEAQELAKSRFMEIQSLKNLLEKKEVRCGECNISKRQSSEDPSEPKYVVENFMNDDRLGHLASASIIPEERP